MCPGIQDSENPQSPAPATGTIESHRRSEGGPVRIEIKGRNVTVGDELRERIEKRFLKIAKQVSELAEMEVELSEEKNPSIPQSQVAEATLRLKGVTLRAHSQSDSMIRAINEVADD